MSTVLDSSIYRNIFSTPETAKIWSDQQRIAYYLEFESALARAQSRLNIIPKAACDQIVKYCSTIEHLDFDELRQETERIGYPVLPVVKQLVKKINEVESGLGEWTHWGTTTQDVTDTATALQIRDTIQVVEDVLSRIIQALREVAEREKLTPMAGRSNIQQAVPMSFGFKIARLLATFIRHRERLSELKNRVLVAEFSGAVGTLATIDPSTSHGAAPPPDTGDDPNESLGMRCQRLFCEEIGLQQPLIAWHTERDAFAEFANFLALLTATCAKFATDLKLLMQTEVNEVREPYVAHRGSSSTMPQKRNPITSAYICSMASSVRTMSSSMVEAMVADHERSTGPWEIEWIVLPQICCLSHACLKHALYLAEGMEVDREAMKRNLDISKGAIVSEAVMMGLGKTLGRQYAHDLVYDLCRKANVEDKSLLELLKDSADIKKAGLSNDELENLCDPGRYLGLSEAMVERVLKQVRG